jgi:hypothetical protein
MRRFTVSLPLALVVLLGLVAMMGRSTHAQEATPDTTAMMAMATHPIVGAWFVEVPDGALPNVFHADGTAILAVPPTYLDPMLGVTTFQGPFVGAWEPTSERGAHFTAIQALSDAEGAAMGSFTFEGYLLVSEDGQRFTADTPDARIIVRDATNAILADEHFPFPVTGYRITPGSMILPEGTPLAGTPTP